MSTIDKPEKRASRPQDAATKMSRPQAKAADAPPDLAKPARGMRLVSLDAYRGFIMLAMASAGFRIAEVAREPKFADSPVWQFLGYQTDSGVSD
ncbi:MAG TPA: hypothetical protein VFW87_14615 [Pirellulales bacterium]|nr:hypothetical protein [Pirellulales bacterium]